MSFPNDIFICHLQLSDLSTCRVGKVWFVVQFCFVNDRFDDYVASNISANAGETFDESSVGVEEINKLLGLH